MFHKTLKFLSRFLFGYAQKKYMCCDHSSSPWESPIGKGLRFFYPGEKDNLDVDPLDDPRTGLDTFLEISEGISQKFPVLPLLNSQSKRNDEINFINHKTKGQCWE